MLLFAVIQNLFWCLLLFFGVPFEFPLFIRGTLFFSTLLAAPLFKNAVGL